MYKKNNSDDVRKKLGTKKLGTKLGTETGYKTAYKTGTCHEVTHQGLKA